MAIVRPRDAATVILVRPDASGRPTVLMGRRSRRAAFVPDVFVFPGGRAEAGDEHLPVVAPLQAGEAARLAAAGAAGPLMARRLASAAVRETWEETGYLVGASTAENDALRPDHSALRFSARAITPRESPIRFHARFFLADGTALTAAPAGSGELTDLAWFPLEEARRLPVIDVTEFVLDALPRLAAGPSQMPLFAYRNGRPAVRWLGAP
ncbi:MAG: NUDIX hydrolase [Alphaproteobacteria bacterium]|nr:NUDIX hydrolase [Alphaproteobacteria bacterium]